MNPGWIFLIFLFIAIPTGIILFLLFRGGNQDGCSRDTDCPSGNQCVNNQCIPGCTTDINCPPNEKCLGTRCTRACINNNQCDAGQICNNGECIAQTFCTDNAQCPSGSQCQNGICISSQPCQNDTTCPQGLVCVNQQCRSCQNTTQCQISEFCTDGLCRSFLNSPVRITYAESVGSQVENSYMNYDTTQGILTFVTNPTLATTQWIITNNFLPSGQFAIFNNALPAGNNTLTASSPVNNILSLSGENWAQNVEQRFTLTPIPDRPGFFGITSLSNPSASLQANGNPFLRATDLSRQSQQFLLIPVSGNN